MKFARLLPLCSLLVAGCADRILPDPDATNVAVKPRIVTTPLAHDTDDPAIWINRANPAQSLVLGTDKNVDGALYVFDAQAFVARGGFPSERIGALEMPSERSHDIDTLADFQHCERLLQSAAA